MPAIEGALGDELLRYRAILGGSRRLQLRYRGLSEANALSEANLAIAIGAGERSEEWKTNEAPIGTFLRATRRRRRGAKGAPKLRARQKEIKYEI